MLTTEINNLNNISLKTSSKEFELKLYSLTHSKKYIIIFQKQIFKIESNLKSINLLISNGCIEDSYTIFRKMLESIFLLSSVLKNPNLANDYIKHDAMVAQKALGKSKEEIKYFVDGKPEGYLEYGYLQPVVDTSDGDFRYTMRTVAESCGLEKYYRWYKITSNFVHNNLSQLKINDDYLTSNLCTMVKEIISVFDFIISSL